MRAERTFRVLSAAALMITFAACGGAGDDVATNPDPTDPPATTTDATIADETATTAETEADETATTDETEAPPELAVNPTTCPEIPDEWSEILDGAVPEAPAPGELTDAVLPADMDGVIALFDALPDELIGGSKAISARSPGHLEAAYQPPDLASSYGFQAMDMRSSFIGSALPEPRADMFVAFWVLSDDDDFVVEAAGHEGDLYWVMFVSTGSGEEIDGIEELYTVALGDSCRPWGFIAAAPTETERDELIAAFIAAAERVGATPDPGPATPAEQAAAATLLTLDDLGPDWFESPRLPQENAGFEELAKNVMGREPVCAAALDWLEQEDVRIANLSDAFAADPIARAESATFTSNFDGISEIEHSVSVFETSDELLRAFELADDLGWADCVIAMFGDLMNEMVQPDMPGFKITLDSAIERPLALGDQAFALHFELRFEAPDGSSIEVTEEFSLVAVGRATSVVTMFSFDHAIDEQADEILALAAARMAQHFGEFG